MAKHRTEGPSLKQETEAITSSPILISSDLAVATEAVGAFIDRGDSRRVIVLIACSLKNNGLDDSEIADLISKLVGYREEEVALISAWMYGNIQAQRRKDRIALLSKVLSAASLRSQMRTKRTAGGRLQ
jgi:hypothetical protein